MVNGYSGFIPRDYKEFAGGLAGFPDESSLARRRPRGVTHVTVNCALSRGPCDAVLDVCDAAPGLRFVMQARWEGRSVHVCQLML